MRRSTIVLLIIIVVMLILAIVTAEKSHAQVYSSWASTQIRHAVEVEKPQVKYDTIQTGVPFQMEIRTSFIYKDFTVEIVHKRDPRVWVYTGSSVFILRPDDEYAILEKLIPLTR